MQHISRAIPFVVWLALVGCGSRTSVAIELSARDASAPEDASPPPPPTDASTVPDLRVIHLTDSGTPDAPAPPTCGIAPFGAPPVSPACALGEDGGNAQLLATIDFQPLAVALDQGSFYLTPQSSGGLGMIPKAGGAFTPILPMTGTNLDAWAWISFDTDAVYLGGWHGIVRIPKAGGCAETLVQESVTGLAVDGTFLYFSHGQAGTHATWIDKVPKTGGAAPIRVAGALTRWPIDSTGPIVGSSIYWKEAGNLCVASTDGTGSHVAYASDYQISTRYVDATTAYLWIRDSAPLDLLSIPVPADAPTTTLLSAVSATSVAGDAVSLYWLGSIYDVSPPFGVKKTAKQTGATEALYTVSSAMLLELDDACVYWFEQPAPSSDPPWLLKTIAN